MSVLVEEGGGAWGLSYKLSVGGINVALLVEGRRGSEGAGSMLVGVTVSSHCLSTVISGRRRRPGGAWRPAQCLHRDRGAVMGLSLNRQWASLRGESHTDPECVNKCVSKAWELGGGGGFLGRRGQVEITALVSVGSCCRVCRSNQLPIQLSRGASSSTETLTKARQFY